MNRKILGSGECELFICLNSWESHRVSEYYYFGGRGGKLRIFLFIPIPIPIPILNVNPIQVGTLQGNYRVFSLPISPGLHSQRPTSWVDTLRPRNCEKLQKIYTNTYKVFLGGWGRDFSSLSSFFSPNSSIEFQTLEFNSQLFCFLIQIFFPVWM